MPVEILEMWNDAYELAERVCGTELEKWQELEPALAEFMGTHLPGDVAAPETSGEAELPREVRDAVLDRDGWQCKFPGCTIRKTLDVHHIAFRSHQGSDEPGNSISLCRIHHDLVHRGICKVSGTVGVDLTFERPELVTEKKTPESAAPEVAVEATPPIDDDDDESWRDEVVADIFDGPPAPQYQPPFDDYIDFLNHWIAQKKASELEDRAKRRRVGRAHVCAGDEARGEASTHDAGGGPGTG